MAMAPLLGWRNTPGHTLLRRVRWPFVVALIGTSVGLSLGVRDGLSVAFLWIATFALGSNVLLLVRTLRQGWLRVGGYLSHVGMALLLVGVLGSYGYASDEVKLVLPQGATQRVFGHSFTFWGYEQRPDGQNVVRLEVDRGGAGAFVALPEVYGDPRSGGQVRRPAIKRSLWQDVYIAPERYLPPHDPNLAEIGPGQEVDIGPYHLRFDGFDIQNRLETDNYALIGANVTITFDGTSQAVVPRMRLEAGKPFLELPGRLPEGRQLVLENFNVQERLVRLRVEGLNLPVVPEQVVFTVSLKPAIALLWLGALLMALGGALAVTRRHLAFKRLPTTAVTGDGKGPWDVFDWRKAGARSSWTAE
jgi:cytochrome c-type biogenesis protein CcmF